MKYGGVRQRSMQLQNSCKKEEREQRKDNHLPIAIESERKREREKITGSGNHLSTGCKMDLTTGDPIIRFVWKRNGRTGEVSLFF